ncbi:DUF305 domain-containing protein [Nocardiopsis sp. N85]|uniref:DUF305 domain-containing protein n=1 Tax=Nocardiopsis sp. N85 TaxID=3029400 RepID=UPI00237F83FA|nr:DUF305 domain-containing protein [Nocardiopsis sp. N85]MDE3724556.1 DUF305 domain-containing protein [Nocardiopsis sp. N85]
MTFFERALTGTAATLITAFALTACGAPEAPETSETPTAEQSTAEFNDADVRFARMMIPHHEQAVVMADLAETRAGDEVADLAERIRDAQGPEIERMNGMLESWGVESGPHMDESGPHMDMDHGNMMEGMLSEEQMDELESAEGEEFDRLFLEYMIEHHEGAVAMAEAEIADGVDAEARELAQEIVDAQEAEIEEMRGMLDPEAGPTS